MGVATMVDHVTGEVRHTCMYCYKPYKYPHGCKQEDLDAARARGGATPATLTLTTVCASTRTQGVTGNLPTPPTAQK